jgi:DNA invertase Pin-like site-specific DNA recombinase
LAEYDLLITPIGGGYVTKKPVAIYLRVSTKEQSTDTQLAELTELVERRGWKYKVFCDKGVSGAKESRPAFGKMMLEVRRGHFGAVCIWALDRLARSLRQLLNISSELERLNVDLVAVKQDLDTSSPSGRLVYGVLSSVAEFERELVRERVCNAALTSLSIGDDTSQCTPSGRLDGM